MTGAESPELIKYREALIKNMEANRVAQAWKSLPSGDKQASIAQAEAFGVSNNAASKAFLEGKTIEDMAKEKGYDPNRPDTWPLPSYPPPPAVRTQQYKANIARAARNAIEPVLTDALAPYQGKIFGYSPKQILQATQNSNADEQGKALAAAYMSTEMQALTGRAAGLQTIGLGMIRDMLKKSGMTLRAPDLLISPEVFRAQQKWITNFGNIINQAENKEAWRAHRELENDKDVGSNAPDVTTMSDAELQRIAGGQ